MNERRAETNLSSGRLVNLDLVFGRVLNRGSENERRRRYRGGKAYGCRSGGISLRFRRGLNDRGNLGRLVLRLGNVGGGGLLRHYALGLEELETERTRTGSLKETYTYRY